MSYQQSANGTAGNVTTLDVAFVNPVLAGSLLVAFTRYIDATNPLTSVTDSLGNTWALATGSDGISTSNRVAIYYAANSLAGANTVHMNGNGGSSTGFLMAIAEYTNVATSSPLDTANRKVDDVGTTTAVSNDITTTVNGDLVVCGYTDTQGRTVTLTAGTVLSFTKREDFGPANRHSGLEDAAQPTSGTTHGDWTISLDDGYICSIAAFKAAAAGAPAIPGGQVIARVQSMGRIATRPQGIVM